MTNFSAHLTDAQAQRLLEDALHPALDAGVRAHHDACAECQAQVESFRALSQALDGLGALEPAPPSDFTAGVLARVEALDRAVARERRTALAVLAAAVAAAAVALGLAGGGALAPALARWAGGLAEATRAWRLGAGFLPTLVGAFRVQILVASAVLALPLAFALHRLVPARRTELV